LEYSVGSADVLFELGWVAQYQGDWKAARQLYDRSVQTSQAAEDEIRAARALNRLGEVAFTVGERDRARQYHLDALQTYRVLGCRYAAKAPLGDLGEIALWEGDLAAARSYAEESLALFRESNDERNAGWVLFMLSEVLVRQGHVDEARATIEQKIKLHQEEGHSLGLDFLLLAFLACAQGEYQRADTFYRKGLEQARHTRFYFPFAIEGLASVAALQGQARRAIALYGVAAALREAFGTPPAPVYLADNERGIATARTQLDEPTFTMAWEAGRAMTPEQAIDFALKVDLD
jgi:tetratricopeptide (TPR) repeat protein